MLQLIGSAFNAIILFIGTYVFGDSAFVIALSILLFWDVVTGAWLAKARGEFNFAKMFKRTIEKIVLYFIFMSAFWIAMNVEMHSTGSKPLFWVDWIGYSWLAANEVSSIVKNIASLRPGFLPAWMVDRFKQFDKTGKF